jgi:hypothetical protein
VGALTKVLPKMEDASLVQVAERNLLDEVDAALLRGDAIEQVNERHHTPLLAAVLAGHADMTALLLERAANPNGCKRVSNGDTPLHVAARTGHAKLLELLLWHGAALVRMPCTCGRRNTNHCGRESAGPATPSVAHPPQLTCRRNPGLQGEDTPKPSPPCRWRHRTVWSRTRVPPAKRAARVLALGAVKEPK